MLLTWKRTGPNKTSMSKFSIHVDLFCNVNELPILQERFYLLCRLEYYAITVDILKSIHMVTPYLLSLIIKIAMSAEI